jgi:hypothetical protein
MLNVFCHPQKKLAKQQLPGDTINVSGKTAKTRWSPSGEVFHKWSSNEQVESEGMNEE